MAPALKRPRWKHYVVCWTWDLDPTVVSHTILAAKSREDAERIVRERKQVEGPFFACTGTVIEERE